MRTEEGVVIDANIIIRFLLNDHEELSAKAREIFKEAESGRIQIYIDEVTIAEVVWVLSSVYKIEKRQICGKIQDIVQQKWVIGERKKFILEALAMYLESNVSYLDSWVKVIAKSLNIKLLTFDKKLSKTNL